MSKTKKMENIPDTVLKAWKQALQAQKNSYAPYSKFYVGAALKWNKVDKIFAGCNYENASFGATICAERSAIAHGISLKGAKKIEFMVIVAFTEKPTVPCGLCLQVMSEFTTKQTLIYLGNEKKILKKFHFHELLPVNFNTLFD